MTEKQKHLSIAVGIFLILVYVYFFLDARIALAIHNDTLPQLQRISKLVSMIGEPALWGVIALLCLLNVAFTSLRRGRYARLNLREQRLTYFCLTILLALLVVSIGKFLLGRERPALLFDASSYGFDFLTSRWERNSMPSGHATLIFAAATCLSSFFRRYLVLFFVLASGIAICRVLATQHYPTDILFGAYLGVMSALLTKSILLRLFDWPGLMKPVRSSNHSKREF